MYRVIEGAANNLPDYQALCAAREILALCRGAGEGEVVIALISGGGSALLPCPLEGVELEDKRMASGSCVHFVRTPEECAWINKTTVCDLLPSQHTS